jgi:electron transport complex protein RnfC
MKIVKSAFKFKGGVHPPYNKELAREKKIESLPMPPELVVSMSQHLGAPAKCIVKAGDHVEKGQLIGERNGFISVLVRAPASGVVKSVENRLGASGSMADSVVIMTDAEQGEGEKFASLDWKTATKEELLKRVEEAGICGMGGAGFPTSVKLSPPPGKRCE